MKPFLTSAPEHPKWEGGYGGGTISPHDLADSLFKESISGPWLTCYMLRRFGWPNMGSDDYKNLMSWALTTPVEGLFLSVTPYLGGSNLHFGILFTEQVHRKTDYDAGRERWFKRFRDAVTGWWDAKGIKIYAWGYGKKTGDADELVHHFCHDPRNPEKVYGLWRRTKRMTRPGRIPPNVQMLEWWLEQLIKKLHPEVKLPKMTKSEKIRRDNPFKRRCDLAIQRTMLDLLRPTNVRDISFNVFGNIEKTYAAKPQPEISPAVERWSGAGHTPQYWYSKEATKERSKANRKK